MPDNPEDLARALQPLVSRLRQDVTACLSSAGHVFKSNEPMTHERLLRHLSGGMPRGMYYMEPGSKTVKASAFDLDDKKKEMSWDEKAAIASKLQTESAKRGLYGVPFRSGGGNGIHTYFIWDKPQDAYSVRSVMNEILAACGLREGSAGGLMAKRVEIFPKQHALSFTGTGNQTFLPLARKSVPLDKTGFMAGEMQPLPRNAILNEPWRVSAPVKFVKTPEIVISAVNAENFNSDHYKELLSFIGFDTDVDYSYEVWLEVGFGLHHASGGSEEGLALWDAWSAKGSSYSVDDFEGGECLYKWETMHEDNNGSDGTKVITGRSIKHRARLWGWCEDISGDFEDLSGIKVEDQKAAGKAAVSKARITPPDALRDGLDSVLIFGDRSNWLDIRRKIRVKMMTCADTGAATAIFSQGAWYLYGGGFWRRVVRIEIEKGVGEVLGSAWVINDKEKRVFNPAQRHITEVVKGLEQDCLIRELTSPMWAGGARFESAAGDWLCLEDGLLNITTSELIPHSPKYFTLNRLPYAWSAEVCGIDEWLKFLDQVWPDDQESIDCLQEWFGYLLPADTSLQKMLLLYGPRRSGKGTIGTLTRLLGAHNIGSTSISALAGQFGLQNLTNKLVALLPDTRNISSRASNIQVAVERMLSISGEDMVHVDRKFEGAWSGYLPCRFVLMANELPAPGDASEAFAGRFNVLRTRISFFGREDTGLEAKLSGEMPGILRWAIEGRIRLKARGHFLQPRLGLADIENMLDANNPVRSFVKSFTERWSEEEELLASGEVSVAELALDLDSASGGKANGEGEWNLDCVPFDFLYHKYGVWCNSEGFHRPERKSIFEKSLITSFEGRIEVKRRRNVGGRSGQVRVVYGMEKGKNFT